MNKVLSRFALVIALLVTASSCSSLRPDLKAPRLALVSVAMTSADIFNQQFLVRVNVENPNDRELPIKGLDYKLFLEGDGFAEGMMNKPFTVPANGETDFDMTVRTNFVSGVGRLLSRLNGRTQVNYSVEGKLLTDIRFLKKIPFSETGSATIGVLK
ncbi:LEA type 2 family protein [Steroidobacter sp.]|uniref:LEA type 2 family protein n=1 Tax=Steroidobacter sp. TaxID=1978227 RepID=UPI001A633DD5|nr:LEA type 2 family protein [Steroidobacter sp.]MBL8269689.1 LEA type 2 family protein [Steroidobacter sp.]